MKVQVASRRLLPAVGMGPACARADVAVADGLQLPYRDACLDAVLCIAVSTPLGLSLCPYCLPGQPSVLAARLLCLLTCWNSCGKWLLLCLAVTLPSNLLHR